MNVGFKTELLHCIKSEQFVFGNDHLRRSSLIQSIENECIFLLAPILTNDEHYYKTFLKTDLNRG
jgi:hypothetical protein